jgi:gliding motility-associated-like protein
MKTKIYFFCVLVFCSMLTAKGQLVINEFMASNSKTIADNKGNYSDWIEIYNSSSQAVNLNNYYISDNPTKLTKHKLFSATNKLMVPAKGFLILWCSGNSSLGENHVNFSLSAESESITLTKPDGKTTIDNLDFTNQRLDISYGRQTDGATTLKYFLKATPNTSNNGAGVYNDIIKNPVFSHIGGYYPSGFNLKITHPDPTVKIYYTTDGSIPQANNLNGPNYFYKNQYADKPGLPNGQLLKSSFITKEYQKELAIIDASQNKNITSIKSSTFDFVAPYLPDYLIPKATVIRAIATKPGYLSSEIITQTYFVNNIDVKNEAFDVIAISAQENHLFDFKTGIYTAGEAFEEFRKQNPDQEADLCTQANFSNDGNEAERPMSFEFYRKAEQKINMDLNMRIHGACSRSNPYKSLRIYGKQNFGNIAFFENSPDLFNKNILLRNAGNDYNGTMFRDAYIHTLIANLKVGTQKSTPTIMYLNGEYWGLSNLRERIDKYYINNLYGVNTENIDMQKIVWTGPNETEYGDNVHYDKMMEFLKNNDLSNNKNYELAITMLDHESLIDYQIAEIFVGNIDWPQNNVRLWRNKTNEYAPSAPYGHDGRWRFLFFDADKSLGMVVNAGYNNLQLALDKSENLIFRSFLKNENFKELFINRFADHLNTTFNVKNSLPLYKKMAKQYESEVPKHIARWKTLASIADWKSKCNVVTNYLETRPDNMWGFLKTQFGYYNTFEIKLASSDLSMGYVQVNNLLLQKETPGVILDNKNTWTGTYFSNLPLTIVAKPLAGYKFLYWIHNNNKLTDAVIVVLSNQKEEYTAVFQQTNLPNELNLPAASLIDCGYYFKEWSPFSSKGSFPPSTRFVFLNQKEPKIDAAIAGFVNSEYNQDSKSRVTGLGINGVSFVNTGGPNETAGVPFGQVGGLLLALNTVGVDSARLSFIAKTIVPGGRKYAIRLQYRTGSEEEFKDFKDPIEYLGSKDKDHTKRFENIKLPESLMNKPYIQFFWKYYYTETGKSGARDELSIDDIVFKVNTEILATQGYLNAELVANNLPNNSNFKLAVPKESFKIPDLKNQEYYSTSADNYQLQKPKTPKLNSPKLEVCGTESLIIKASGCVNGTIFWSNGSIGREIEVKEGSYDAYCSSTCGISENSASIKIKRVNITKAPLLSLDKEKVCAGETVNLKVNACTGKVFWSNGLQGNSILLKPIVDTYLTANCFENQCNSETSEQKLITIGKPNKPKISSTNTNFCLGETSFISGQNCDGLIKWSNGFLGETIKFTPTTVGDYIFKAQCRSKDGACESDWSDPIIIKSNKNPEAPKTIVEIYPTCGEITTNLNNGVLENTENGKIFFHTENNLNSAMAVNAENAAKGNYYVFKRSDAGCFSTASIIAVKTKLCAESATITNKSPFTDLKISTFTNKKIVKIGEAFEIKIVVKNQGKTKASNIEILSLIPNKLNISTTDAAIEFNDGILSRKIKELAAKDSIVISYDASLTISGKLILSALILKLDETDNNPKNNRAEVIINDEAINSQIGASMIIEEPKKIADNKYEIKLKINLKNLGKTEVKPVNVSLDFDKIFGNGAMVLDDEKPKVSTLPGLIINENYIGRFTNAALLTDTLCSLKALEKQTINVSFKVNIANAEVKTFYANAMVLNSDNENEFSTDGINVDPDFDGDAKNNSEPSKISFANNNGTSSIACAQVIVDSIVTNAKNHIFTFMVLIKNTGSTDLKKVKLSNDLFKTFGSGVVYKQIGSPSFTNILTYKNNVLFDGKKDKLITQGYEKDVLKSNQIDSVFYTISLSNREKIGPYFNNVFVSAQNALGNMVSDTSNSGLTIKAQFSDPTVIAIPGDLKNQVNVNKGFSPNSDGSNETLDIFIPEGIILSSLYIYDRNGLEIINFMAKDVINDKINWDGKNKNGKKVPNGTYYYSYKTTNDNKTHIDFLTVQY